jgi:hypothetical protein
VADHPADPFENWPIQAFDPQLGVYCWFARPAVFVSQAHQPHATLEHARFIATAMDGALSRNAQAIDMHNGMLVIHDWRTVTTLADEARGFYSKRIEAYKRGSLRGAYVATGANPLLRAILKLGAMALPFRTGHPVEIVDDPLPLLAEHNIVPVYSPHALGLQASLRPGPMPAPPG